MARKTYGSPAPDSSEQLVGWFYLIFQLLLLPSVLRSLNRMLPVRMTETELNFTFFLVNFLAILWIFHNFLGRSASHMVHHPIDFLQAVVLGLAAYWASNLLITTAIRYLEPGFRNVNDASIASLSRGNFYLMAVGTVILVPPVEECFYRGLIFRGLVRKAPWAAYLCSMLAFSLVHVVGYMGQYTPMRLFLCTLQYLPAGLSLAWAYTKADTIFAPIVIHGLINAYGIYTMR